MRAENCILLTITHKEYETFTDLVWLCREHKLDWEDVLPLVIDGDGATDGVVMIRVEREEE